MLGCTLEKDCRIPHGLKAKGLKFSENYIQAILMPKTKSGYKSDLAILALVQGCRLNG